jgi:autotransporter-associated beta strand protein
MNASRKIALAVSMAAIAVWSGRSLAQSLVVKADNANNLSDPGSWTLGVVPGATDKATWDATITTANTTNLGTNLSFGGIVIGTTSNTPVGDVTINGANTLTLGQYGVDMSVSTGNLTINTPITLGASQTWNIATGRTLTTGNVAAGTNVLSKTGGGAVVMSGMTTSASYISANGGSLSIGGTVSLSTPMIIGTTNTATAVTFSGILNAGSNTVTKVGGGTLNVNSLSFTGDTVPLSSTAGTIAVSTPLTFIVPTTVTAGGTLSIAGTSTNGSNVITKTGTGTVNFSGGLSTLSSFSALNVQAGQLNLTQSAQVNFTGAQTWSIPAGAGLNISRPVAFSGNLLKTGGGNVTIGDGTTALTNTGAGSNLTVNAGTLTLYGNRTDAGDVTIGASGTLVIGNASTVTSFNTPLGLNSTVTFNGGTLQSTFGGNPTAQLFGNVVVPAGQTGTINMSNRFVWGQANAAYTHTLTGSGTINVVANSASTRDDFNVSMNQFTGQINFSGTGGIRFLFNTTGARFTPPTNATVDFGGSVTITSVTNSNGNTFTMAGMSGSSPTAILLGGFTSTGAAATASTYSTGLDNKNYTFAGQIQGNANFTKNGTGTQIFTGQTLSYSGTTTINGGKLQLDGIKSGAGVINVNNTASLAGNGTVTATGGPVVVFSGGNISPGASVGLLTLNTAIFSNGATGSFEFRDSSTYDQLVVSTLNLFGTTSLSLFNENTTSTYATNGTYNLVNYTTLGGTSTPATGLAVANAVAGKKYTFSTAVVNSLNYVTLTIADDLAPVAWAKDASGNWNDGTNWSSGLAPSVAGSTAIFGSPGTAFTAARTISLNGADRTVGTISLNDSNTVTVSGGLNKINLNNAGAPGLITALNGNHVIDAEVALTTDGATFNVSNATNTLTFNQTISGVNASVNKTGAGLIIFNKPVTYSGPTTVTAGTLRLNGGDNTLPTTVTPQISGTLDLNGTKQTFPNLSGSGTVTNLSATDSVLTLTTDGQSLGTPISDGPTNKISVTFTGTTLVGTIGQPFTGGLKLTNDNSVLNTAVGNPFGNGPIFMTNGSSINLNFSSSSSAIFLTSPISVPSNGTIYLSSGSVSNGVASVFTFGAQPGTVTFTGSPLNGATTVSLSSANQQFVGNGTLFIPSGFAVRWSASTGLNTGGPGVFAVIEGTMTTRNVGAVALGAITGGGTLTSGNAGTNGTTTYTIGSLNSDAEFTGTVRDSDTTHFTGVTKVGTGTQTFSGAVTYSGLTTISGGALQIGNTGGDSSVPAGNITNNSLLIVNRGPDVALTGNISGTGSLSHIGTGKLTLAGSTTYTGNTTVTNGPLVVQRSLRPVTGSLVVTGPGSASLEAAPTSVAASGYTVAGQFSSITASGVISLPAVSRTDNKATVLVTGALSIATGGSIDLGSGDMIVHGGASQLASIRSWLTAGTITASATLASSPVYTANTTLALFVNDAGGGVPYFASYDGITGLTSSDVILKYTYAGDTNLDGVLDGKDFKNAFEGFINGASGWAAGDVNNSGGAVDATDWSNFLAYYTSYTGQANPLSLGNGQDTGSGTNSIPEPSALGLLSLPAAALTRRRRTR